MQANLKTSSAFMYYTNGCTNMQLWIMKCSHYVHYSQAISGVYVSFMSMSWATWKRLRLIRFLYTAICLKIFCVIHWKQICMQKRMTYKLTMALQSNIFDFNLIQGLGFHKLNINKETNVQVCCIKAHSVIRSSRMW